MKHSVKLETWDENLSATVEVIGEGKNGRLRITLECPNEGGQYT